MIHFPPKKILVPFDFSDLSDAAWKQAVALARCFQCRLEVVFVQKWPITTEMAMMPPQGDCAQTRDRLMARIRKSVGAGSKALLVSGDPALSILRLARSRKTDMIVMGTHGRTGLKRALLGSVAEAVVRQSPVPVLAVRGKAAEIRSVVAPVNFTGYSYFGFTYAAALAAALDVPLTTLHVHADPLWSGDPQRKLELLIKKMPSSLRQSVRTVVETGETEPLRGITKAAGKNDLVVLVAHENSSVKEIILGTTAERVLRGAVSSVLVVPAPRRAPLMPKELPAACCAAS